VEIKAEDVKTLREKTGAGMMDCKKALTEAGGDFAKAEKILKEQGLAAAAKRSGRATNEGRVFTKVCPGRASIVELSCETDFVARNADFIKLGT
jgi:elongation factor Ts